MDEGTHYKRITLVIEDIERSLTIYRDILGFTLHHINESDADSYSYPVFRIPPEAKIRFATLDSPDQVRTIGFTEVKGIELPKERHPHMTASVIRVKGLEEVMAKIAALGLYTTDIKTDDNTNGLSFKEQSFVDFDGHLIVLYEMTPE